MSGFLCHLYTSSSALKGGNKSILFIPISNKPNKIKHLIHFCWIKNHYQYRTCRTQLHKSDLPSFVHFFDLTNDVPSATLIGPNKTIDLFCFQLMSKMKNLSRERGMKRIYTKQTHSGFFSSDTSKFQMLLSINFDDAISKQIMKLITIL